MTSPLPAAGVMRSVRPSGREAGERAALALQLAEQALEVREALLERGLEAREAPLALVDPALRVLDQPVEAVLARLDQAVGRAREQVDLCRQARGDADAGAREKRRGR